MLRCCVMAAGAIVGPSLFDDGRQWLCTLCASLCVTSCVVSLLSIGCISVNRYVYICHHEAYRRLFARYTYVAIVAATWVVGVAIDLPCHVGWSVHTFDRKTQKCLWDRTLSHQYTVFYVTVGMLLPLSIIVLCYWRIFVHIREAKLRILQARSGGGGGIGAWTTQAAIVKTIRQIKVIVMIFIAFCICWAPYAVVLLSDEFDVFPLSVHLYASMIAHLHASVNFFIYGLTNKSLRKGYRDFVVRRLFGLCCSSMAADRAAYSTDQSIFTRSYVSCRSFDATRTSRSGRKTVTRNRASVLVNELPPNQSPGDEHIECATSYRDTVVADGVHAPQQHQPCTANDTDDVVAHVDTP